MSTVKPPPPADAAAAASEPPRQQRRTVKRFLLACAGIALLSGAATAVFAVDELNRIVDALGESKAVSITGKVLAHASSGGPQTLLLVGDDRRPPPKNNPNGFVVPHSNEMLLVRIDPSKPTISMLSIPRELRVTIYPPHAPPVTNRINVAYTIGGIQLMTETIKRVLGISVNHVFVVTFPKFKRAVNEMGCVYMTVDRRYYHVNEPGGEQYFEINLQPGYQRLCGQQALEFVANRHEDTSLTRDARDQRFLLEVKAQYGATLFENREQFERIFGRAVETDLHGSGQVLDLLRLLVASQGKPVRQVPFKVNLLATYDTATPQQISESVRSFLRGTAPIAKHKLTPPPRPARRAKHSHSPAVVLTPTPSQALAKARSASPDLPFAIEYPRARDSYGGAQPDTLRAYRIRDQHGHSHPAYVAVIDRGPLGEFYDVQGTTWPDPPLLSNPGQTVRVGSRTYALFYAGEQVRVIAWREGNATYWIQNTLTNSVSPQTMLAMAEQTVPVIGSTSAASNVNSSGARGFALPPRAANTASLFDRVGAALGFLGLIVLGALAVLVIARQRELNSLREQVAHAMALEARQRPALAAAGLLGVERPAAASARTRTSARAKRKLAAAAGAALLTAGAIALAVGLLGSHSKGRGGSQGPVDVAVFNASSVPGTAHKIAQTLSAAHEHVAHVGNIGASLGPGTFIFYPPGAQAQGQRVAQLLSDRAPVLEPIQPQVQSAVGHHNEIVVVVD